MSARVDIHITFTCDGLDCNRGRYDRTYNPRSGYQNTYQGSSYEECYYLARKDGWVVNEHSRFALCTECQCEKSQ